MVDGTGADGWVRTSSSLSLAVGIGAVSRGRWQVTSNVSDNTMYVNRSMDIDGGRRSGDGRSGDA
jgi:hypothetical protein